MLNPCSPCVCKGAPCEQCLFGYQSKENNHKSMKELLLDYMAGKKSVGWKCAELYMSYHKNWREELDEDVVEKPVKNSSELKPCPFCGGEAILCKELTSLDDRKAVAVKCQSCGCNTGFYIVDGVNTYTQTAINAWNKRIT